MLVFGSNYHYFTDVASGNLPVVVMGEIFDFSTIKERETYFSFLESRVDTFKKVRFFFQ